MDLFGILLDGELQVLIGRSGIRVVLGACHSRMTFGDELGDLFRRNGVESCIHDVSPFEEFKGEMPLT